MSSDPKALPGEAAAPLRPGESRVLYTKPCPPHMYSHPNFYFILKRAARRLVENDFGLMWENDWYFDSCIEAIRKLRDTARLFPAKPWKRWEQERMGDVLEICCPSCQTVFQWEGHFYAPQCPGCKHWLNERPRKEDGPCIGVELLGKNGGA